MESLFGVVTFTTVGKRREIETRNSSGDLGRQIL